MNLRPVLLLAVLAVACENPPPEPKPLRGGVDNDRPDRANGIALAQEIEPDDPACRLGDHAEHRRMADEGGDAARRDVDRGEGRRKAVARVDGIETLGDIHASSEYRAHLARVYTRRALEAAAARVGNIGAHEHS